MNKEDKPPRKESDTFFKWLARRTLKQNRNALITVLGDTGSGKSYACLRILERMNEIVNPGTKPDIRNCARTLPEFMERLKYVKKGDVLILEEVGVNLSASTWASKINRIMNHIMQTFRTQNLVVLLNLPNPKMLDINARRLLHGRITMKGINIPAKLSKISFKRRQYNSEFDKEYWKYLRTSINRREVKIPTKTLNKPADWLCEEYEKRRKEYTDRLKDSITKEVTMTLQKEQQRIHGGNGNPLTERQQEVVDIYLTGVTKVNDIGEKMGISGSYASCIMKAITKKHPSWRNTPILVQNA